MKLLVFAHSPPPHHGQSYMVKLMLDGLGGDRRGYVPSSQPPTEIECYHVNARFSDDMEEIGEMRLSKAWLLLRYCAEAVWCRFHYKADHFYYVPAPGKRVALYRDWVVMLLCRPFFKKVIFHWHATGIGDWLLRRGTFIERWITHLLMDEPALSLALSISSMRDSLWFVSGRTEIVANGIPNPCPDFENTVLPLRRARTAARRKLLDAVNLLPREREDAGGDPHIFKVLYLAHCTREKGIFDVLDAVALANRSLRESHSPLAVHLTVAGAFLHDEEEREFYRRIAEGDLGADAVTHAGFVEGENKRRLFRESDCYCFPTYYAAEGQPVSLIEAMAYGLAVVTTAWRAIPEVLPPEFPGFVLPRAPQQIAATFQLLFRDGGAAGLRERFVANFTEERHLQVVREALCQMDSPSPAAKPEGTNAQEGKSD